MIVNEATISVGAGTLILTVSLLSGNSIIQSAGVALMVICTILLGIDMLGVGKYKKELERLTSGGLWVNELETLSGKDLDGDNEVGRNE